jgi:hypothetical protein
MMYSNITRGPVPGEAIHEVDDLITTVRLWGWPPEIAFVVAMQLRVCGVTAVQARWMFDDALRRVQ